MSRPPRPRQPTPEELRAIATGGTVATEVMRWLKEVDDGSVAAELELLRSQSQGNQTVSIRTIAPSDDRFLDEFAAAHKAGVFGGQSIVEAPQAEGYEIEEELSRGAQGAVFRARQTATRRQVALKVLLRGAFASLCLKPLIPSSRQRIGRPAMLWMRPRALTLCRDPWPATKVSGGRSDAIETRITLTSHQSLMRLVDSVCLRK